MFAQGRCELLLGDLIALADRDPSQIPRVVELVEAVCHDLTTAFMPERRYPLSSCVPTLYADRIRPGGRLDTWYLNPATPSFRPEETFPLSLRLTSPTTRSPSTAGRSPSTSPTSSTPPARS